MKKVNKKNDININVIVFFITFFLIFLLGFRGAILSLSEKVDGVNLKNFANNRTTRTETILAKRGGIYSSNGDILAENVYSYTLIAYLSSSRGEGNYVKNKEEASEKLSTVLDMSKDEIFHLLSKNAYQTEFGNKGRGLTEIVKDKIIALNIQGLDFIESQKRYYPNGKFLSYTLGYAKLYNDGKIVGELGLESSLNNQLQGQDGYRVYQKDLKGYKIANTKEVVESSKNGNNVYLTIDNQIQFFAEQAMNNVSQKYSFEEINLVVADAKTGKILAMTSSPSFDPNKKDMTKYLDPNVSISFEPGSTMKIFSYMAAMEYGKYNGNATFKSGIFVTKDKTEIGDWNRNGWGVISYDKGFALSSNVGVVNLLNTKVNGDELKEYYKRLGFGEKTHIGLSFESRGKLDFKYETEIYNAGFGQGIMTTAIQNIKALTSIANDGILLEPYLIEKITDYQGNILTLNKRKELGRVASKNTTDKIKDLMEAVVLNGTGSSYSMPGYNLIAKTGTAQIASTNGRGYLKGENDVIRGFAGIYPKDDPKIIIYANVKRPKPNSPQSLVNVVKEIITNISTYLNIKKDDDVNKLNEYRVESFVNKDIDTIKSKLDTKNIKYLVIGNGNKIIKQIPEYNSKIYNNSKIYLLTNYKDKIMPNLINYSLKDAINILFLMNIKYKIVGSGYVRSQSILPNTNIGDDSLVELVLKD